jgi:hypothetical protein
VDAAIQIGVFRNAGDLAYLPVATTGNLMRFMESTFSPFRCAFSSPRTAIGFRFG